jgi:DNA-binding transcriptional MerR regulator/methylmalonyl-CoA mutase cobalamin-binding subunit
MYTIKQASIRTGVPVALLRQWERRYGVVAPVRTASGYRRYDEPAVARLRLMRSLVDQGWSPSNAAAELGALDDADVMRRLGETDASVPTPAGPLPHPGSGELVDRFVAAAAALRSDAIETVLDEMFARGSFERVMADHLMPALRAVGAAWGDGTIDVAAEHFASSAVLRRLSAAFQSAGRPRPGERPILVGMPPGARHELGALAFAIVARRSGMPVVYLGADLPVTDWVRSATDTNAWAAVIGVVSAADVRPALEVAEALRAGGRAPLIAFGGGAVSDLPDPTPGLTLQGDLVEATEAIGMARGFG